MEDILQNFTDIGLKKEQLGLKVNRGKADCLLAPWLRDVAIINRTLSDIKPNDKVLAAMEAGMNDPHLTSEATFGNLQYILIDSIDGQLGVAQETKRLVKQIGVAGLHETH